MTNLFLSEQNAFSNLLDLLFLGFSVNLILSCLLTISAYNAVGALMALMFAFVNATCLFFLMELEFVGLLFLIVYLGAICVLFLFSVMLFNLKDVVRTKTTSFILTSLFTFLAIAFIALSLFQYFIDQNPSATTTFSEFFSNSLYQFSGLFASETALEGFFYEQGTLVPNSSLYFIGQVFYGRYLLYLILASVILLVAMLGAVVLINNSREQNQIQHILHQMTKTPLVTNLS